MTLNKLTVTADKPNVFLASIYDVK